MTIDTSKLDIFNNLPDEEILGTYWYIDIDDLTSKVKTKDYNLSNGIADKYIHKVDIPLPSIEYEKTSWGMVNAKDFEIQGECSIEFTSNVKAEILSFCKDWLDSVFDLEKCCFKSDYRNQCKTFKVVSFRPFNKTRSLANSVLTSTFSNVIGYYNSVSTTVDKFKTLIGKGSNKETKSNLDIQICEIYEIEDVYPSKLEDVSFDDEDSDRKSFTLTCECGRVKKLYGKDIQ